MTKRSEKRTKKTQTDAVPPQETPAPVQEAAPAPLSPPASSGAPASTQALAADAAALLIAATDRTRRKYRRRMAKYSHVRNALADHLDSFERSLNGRAPNASEMKALIYGYTAVRETMKEERMSDELEARFERLEAALARVSAPLKGSRRGRRALITVEPHESPDGGERTVS